MGNQNSQSRGGSCKELKHHRQRQLEKSASCGMIMSQDNDDNKKGKALSWGQAISLVKPSVEVQCKESTSIHSILGSEEQTTSSQEVQNKVSNKHHYNIHHPNDLLRTKSGKNSYSFGSQESNTSFGKRSNSALEFITSSKSPLGNLIRGRRGKGSFDRLDVSKEDYHCISPCSALAAVVKSGSDVILASQKMNCNLDKFSKLLSKLSGFQKQGLISEAIFEKHLVPHSSILSKYLWKFFTHQENSDTISESRFVQSAEQIYTFITDKDQITFYLKVFGYEKDIVDQDGFMDFLISAYQISTVGTRESSVQMSTSEDFNGKEYLESVVKACYHIKDEMSICFLSNWLLTNLPRFLILMHKYILHQLTTGYTQLTTGNKTINMPTSGVTAIPDGRNHCRDGTNNGDGDEYNKTETTSEESSRLNPVLLWLFRSSLPNKYVSIFDRKPEQPSSQSHALNPSQLILQLLHSKAEPEKWSLLYNSDSDGLSINRFQFHVFNYRGPTLMIITADNGYSMAIASDCEWKESCHFWGGEEAVVLQLTPEFRVVEKGTKILYANFSIRGYPFGIQAGKDPRNVSLEIKPDFTYASFKKIPCRIEKFLVYGCAPQQTKVSQTEFKKWEAKQCENIRKVNINSAEWKDNPDKYLLELAGAYKSYDN